MFNSKENGFSLIELIVVLIITAILAQIGFVAFNRYTRKTRAFAAKTAINNIKKECETNRDLGLEEVFTSITTKGYEINPKGKIDCFGDPSTGKISLIPNDVDKSPTFFYEHLLGLISQSGSTNINSNQFNEITPLVLQSSCGMSRYGQMWGALDRRRPASNATDGDPSTKWNCRGNVQMTFDLGNEKTINSINIVKDDGGYIEIYVDNQLVKEEYLQNDPNNQNLFKTIDLDNVKGRIIEYRSRTTYPKHRNTEVGEFTVSVQ